MRKILLIAITTLIAISTGLSLEPMKVAFYTTNTGVQTVRAEIRDNSSGTIHFVGENYTRTPNDNGIIIIDLKDNGGANGSLSGVLATAINTSVTVDIYVGGSLFSQQRLDALIMAQAQNGILDQDGNLTPPENGSGDVGTDELRWSSAYFDENTVHIGPAEGEANDTEMRLSYDDGTNTGTITIDDEDVIDATSDLVTINKLVSQEIGDNNTAFGTGALFNNTGQYVSAFGKNAAYLNSGWYVNANGTNAGNQNSGLDVNANGHQAAFENSGSDVNANGYLATYQNSGDYVNANGHQAARENTGDHVNANGQNTARDNTGENINAFGYQVARENTGDNINAFGDNAAYQNEGSNVNFNGFQSGYRNDGDNVNAYGYEAARENSGNNVVALGQNAGWDGTNGNSMNGQFIISNNTLPSYANRAAATTAITTANGAVSGNTYMYYNQTTFTIEAVRLP